MASRVLAGVAALGLVCGICITINQLEANGGKKMSIKVASSAFKEGEMIPAQYTCDGKNVSPPLEWSGVPEGTKSLALICDDPDAPMGTWVHWVLFNLPANIRTLPEGMSRDRELKGGGRQGTNDFRKIGYDGPCPPGGTHRYYFKVYAVDCMLNIGAGATKAQLVQAMEKHVLAQGQLMGRYRRA